MNPVDCTFPFDDKANNERRFNALLEGAGLCIWEHDQRTGKIAWNRALRELMGCQSDQDLPTRLEEWIDLIHPDDLAEVYTQEASALLGSNPLYCAEYRMRKQDGNWLWVSSKGQLIERDEMGKPTYAMGIIEDISVRKHTEILLKAQYDLAFVLSAQPDRDILLSAILNSALSLPDFDGGGIYWRNDSGSYSLASYSGLSDAFIKSTEFIPENSWQANIMQSGRVICSFQQNNQYCVNSNLVHQAKMMDEEITALVVIPIIVNQQPLACLNLASKHMGVIGKQTLIALENLTLQFNQCLERQLAQEEAVKQRENFRELFESLNDYLFILDLEGNIIHYNNAVTTLLGYGQNLIGCSVLQVHPEFAREQAAKVMQDMIAGKKLNCPLPLQKANGDIVYVDTRVVHGIWDGKQALFGISRDVTEEVKQREALRQEKQFTQDIINSLPGIFYMFDNSGRLINWNKRFEQLTGFNNDQLFDMVAADFFEGEDKERIAATMAETYKIGQSSMEAELCTVNGQKIPHLFTGQRTIIDGFIYLVGLGIDITEMRKAQQALDLERIRLETLFRAIPDLVWLKDKDGVFLACNTKFESLYSFPTEYIIGKTDYDFVDAETADSFRQHDLMAIEADRPTINNEWLTFGSNGYRGYFQTIKTPMYTSHGQLIGVLGIARDVTEAKLSEKALEETAMFLRQTQSIAKVGGWKVNPLANTVLWTEEVYRLVEHPLSHPPVTLEEALIYYAPETLTTIRNNLLDAWENDKPFTIETEMIAASGRRFWAELRSIGRIEEEGGVFITGTFQDISERKHLMEQLRQRERYQRSLLDNFPFLVWLKDEKSRFLAVNQPFAEACGWPTPDEIAGKTDFDVWPSDLAQAYQKDDRDVLNTGMAKNAEEALEKDGKRIWIETYKSPVSVEGRVIGTVGFARDITERKQMENDLRESELRFRAIYEQSLLGIALVNFDDYRFISANPAYCQMLGYTEDELQQLTMESVIYKDDLISESFWGQLSTDGLREFLVDRRQLGKNGDLVWTTVASTAIFDEAGKPLYLLCISENITHRHQAEQALKELNDSLEQRVLEESAKNREKDILIIQQSRFAAMGEMIGNIAHQWRQPLNTLGLCLANIEDAYNYNDLTVEYLSAQILEGNLLIHQMSTTIDDFRNFFKPNKEIETFSVEKAIIESISLVSACFQNNNIEIELKSVNDAIMKGFSNEFSQVLLNIFSNSKDAIMQNTKENGKVIVHLDTDSQWVIVTISDNGFGIPEHIINNIFEPYFSTKELGTGIGLYMSKMIIENSMHGHIFAKNSENGAVFTIYCMRDQ